eukprot:Trichotokara_eunicae@DN4244_c0_g1_i1.p1
MRVKQTPAIKCAIGICLTGEGEPEGAMEVFRAAAADLPKSVEVLTLYGHACVEVSDFTSAFDAYTKATIADPSDYRGWFGLAQLLELKGEHSTALLRFIEAIRLCTNDASLWMAAGELNEKLTNWQDAAHCFINSHQLSPESRTLEKILSSLSQADSRMEGLEWAEIWLNQKGVDITQDQATPILWLQGAAHDENLIGFPQVKKFFCKT